MSRSIVTRALAFTLVALLCGAPQVLAQTQQQTTPPPEEQQAAPQPQQPNITADPTQGPVEPAQTTAQPDQQQPAETDPYVQKYGTLPNAPSASQQPAQSQQQPAPSTSKPQEPAGTAAAGEATTVGGAASKPAGTAIAPAKQRQVRSLLIKLGAIAAAGAAVGIVYGLSKGTSSRPPGATTTTAPAPAP